MCMCESAYCWFSRTTPAKDLLKKLNLWHKLQELPNLILEKKGNQVSFLQAEG